MALVRWQATVQNDVGAVVVNPSITVRNAADNSIATIYNDAGVVKTNPFTGGLDGFVSFRATSGRYIIEGVKGGLGAPDWVVDLISSHESDSEQLGLNISSGLLVLKQDNGPLLIVATGQSNMIGSNTDTSGVVTTDPGVKIWNQTTSSWQISQPGVPAGPYTYNTIGATYPNPNNAAHQFALRLRRETGRLVYIVLDARGSTSVKEWTTAWTVRDMFGNLTGKVAAALTTPELAGKVKADVVLWQQGEQDAGMAASAYRAEFYSMYARFKAASWFDQDRPFITGALAEGTIYDTQNVFLGEQYRYGVTSIVTASSAGLGLDSSGIHFTGAALEDLGYNRYFAAYSSWLANRPARDEGDIYKTAPLYYNATDLDGRAVADRTLKDALCTTPDGLRSNTGPFTELEGRMGYRTLIGPALPSGGTVPTDMPGGMFRLTGNVLLPSVVALGYTVTLINASTGRVTVTPPGAGTIATEQGNVTSLGLAVGERITIVAFASDGSSWFIKAEGRFAPAQASVNDDAVLALSPQNNAGQLAITINPTANLPDVQLFGSVAFDVGTSPNCIKLYGGTKFNAVATDVTGTTGTDGQITVGVIAGAVRIENRSGNAVTVRWQWVA